MSARSGRVDPASCACVGQVEKRYRAVLVGRLPASEDAGASRGTVDAPLDGAAAVTQWAVVHETQSLKHG